MGWEISVIGFGGIKLPLISKRECEILLNKAIDGGINFVDTADCYGDSEEKIGLALRGRRKGFYLSTKIDERDSIGVRKKLERCLCRLRTDWIDLVLFHDVRDFEYDRIFNSGGLETLQKAREEGKILEIGISIHHSIPMMMKAIESGVRWNANGLPFGSQEEKVHPRGIPCPGCPTLRSFKFKYHLRYSWDDGTG